MNITIRLATVDEITAWWDSEIAKNPADNSNHEYKAQFLKHHADGTRRIFYGWDGGTFIGQASLLTRGDDPDIRGNGKAEINKLDLAPEYRGKGIASKFKDHLEEYARKHGLHTLTIGVEPHETRYREIYKKWGYDNFIKERTETYKPKTKGGKGETITVLYYSKEIRPTWKKVTICGAPGSGKSYVALRLGKALDLPIIHFDNYTFNPDGTFIDKKIFTANMLERLGDKWITDGNHSTDDELTRRRFTESDAIIFLDLPEADCIAAVKARHGTKREDWPDHLPETDTGIDWLVNHIKKWHTDEKPKTILGQIEKYGARERLIHLHSREGIDAFLANVIK